MTKSRRVPLYPDLYNAAEAEVMSSYAVWPSAYASGKAVQLYKAKVREVYGEKAKPYAGEAQSKDTGLTKWFGEEWVDLSRPIHDEDGDVVGYEPCGRKSSDDPADYPKCRPVREAMRMTPDQVADAVRRKRRAEASTPAAARGHARSPTRVATYRTNPASVDPLAAWCASNESYDVLNQTEAAEGTWQAGGCVLLAQALKALYPEGRLVGIDDTTGVQHVGLLVGDTVYDANGAHAKQAWVRDWIEYEGLDPRRSLAHLVTIRGQPLPGPASRRDVRLVVEALAAYRDHAR
jgi:hypothetical protein